MFPWSYSCKKPTSDDEDLFEAAIGAAQAVRGVHGRSFEVGSVCQVSLTSPGESVDWTCACSFFTRSLTLVQRRPADAHSTPSADADAKVRWSFAIELRGGVYGFLLPPAQILPSGEETHAGLVSLAEFVAKVRLCPSHFLTRELTSWRSRRKRGRNCCRAEDACFGVVSVQVGCCSVRTSGGPRRVGLGARARRRWTGRRCRLAGGREM